MDQLIDLKTQAQNYERKNSNKYKKFLKEIYRKIDLCMSNNDQDYNSEGPSDSDN